MAPSTERVLKKHGLLRLVETTNPAMGVGYSVWKGSFGLWSGLSLEEAEQEFHRASMNR